MLEKPSVLYESEEPPRWHVWGCFVLMLVGLYLVVGPKVALSRWNVTPDSNTALEEALCWRQGTLELSRSYYEDAVVDGKRYNAVGLAFAVISLVGTTLTDWLGGGPDRFYAPFYVAMVAMPLPIVGFWAFRAIVRSPAWAAVLTFYLIAGTSLRPMLTVCRTGSLYEINHVLAVWGLLLVCGDLLGKQRIWPAALGLCVCFWSRQATCLYAVPLLWLAWRSLPARGRSGQQTPSASTDRPGKNDDAPGEGVARNAPPIVSNAFASSAGASASAHAKRPRRSNRAFIAAALGVAFVAAVPMTLNTLKFGSPFDTGYRLLYADRTDAIARDANDEFWGPRYAPRHLWAMNVAYPRWDIRGGTLYPIVDDVDGGSIWFTSPLLLAIFVTARHWWRDGRRRMLMLASVAVVLVLICYHTTGARGAGFYRYSLDFIPVWLAVVAPYVSGPRGRNWTIACLAYSSLYFNVIGSS